MNTPFEFPDLTELKCSGCGLVLLRVRKLRHDKMKSEVVSPYRQFTTADAQKKNTGFACCQSCGATTDFAIGWLETVGPVPVA
jgi:hypothetical protein